MKMTRKEAIAITLEAEAKAKLIVDSAIRECRRMGVSVFATECGGEGREGQSIELTPDVFDFIVDVKKYKENRVEYFL